MSFRFRVRFHLSPRCGLGCDRLEIALANPEIDGFSIILKSRGGAQAISEAEELVLIGSSWPTADEATAAATSWLGYLQVAFARFGVAADFGDRAPGGGRLLVDEGKVYIDSTTGARYFDDVHGILVYADVEQAVFGRVGAIGLKCVQPIDRLLGAVDEARSLSLTQDAGQRLAYDLFSGSFFQPSADARFMMLMMAFETLAEQHDRSDEVRNLINDLTAQVSSSDLPAPSKESLQGGLRSLKREGVTEVGRRLAAVLGERTYDGLSAAEFFSRCTKVRNNLVHGGLPRRQRDEVDRLAATLEVFVGDLIAVKLIDASAPG